MNNQPQTRYIKTFNKGQMTIPKEVREDFGIGDESWLKLYAQRGKIIMEPVKEDKKFDISMEKIRGVPSRTVAGSPWVKELYAHFAPVREEASVNYTEEEVNATIDKAVAAVRKKHD